MEKVKQYLLAQKKKIEEKLKIFNQEDTSEVMYEELGTQSLYASIGNTNEAIKNKLVLALNGVEHALRKIKEKTYGKCESCGEQIEEARLRVIPTAFLCAICSQNLHFNLY